MALFKFTKAILNNKKIDVYNKGEMYRDFTYIDDVAKSIELLIKIIPKHNSKTKYKNDSISKVAPFRVINIGNQDKVHLGDYIKTLEKELKIKSKKKLMPMQKGDVKLTLSNANLLKQITGYTPKVKYELGIKRFVKWYRSNYKI